jgi:hypothetical protein
MREGGGAPSVAGCHPATGISCADAGAAAIGGDPLRFYQVRGVCAGTEGAE